MNWLCKGVSCTILPFSLSLVQSHLLFYLYFFTSFSSTYCLECRNVVEKIVLVRLLRSYRLLRFTTDCRLENDMQSNTTVSHEVYLMTI
jgi:hypothetical protein